MPRIPQDRRALASGCITVTVVRCDVPQRSDRPERSLAAARGAEYNRRTSTIGRRSGPDVALSPWRPGRNMRRSVGRMTRWGERGGDGPDDGVVFLGAGPAGAR